MAYAQNQYADATNQTKYYNDVKEAYIRERDVRPLFKYMKTTSTKNAKYAVYYSSGTLVATDFKQEWDVSPAVGITGTPTPGTMIVPALPGIATENQNDPFTSHQMGFKKKWLPYWIAEDDIENTMVDLNNTIIKEQVRGIIHQEEKDMVTQFKLMTTNSFPVMRANNQEDFVPSMIGVPSANIFGDPTQVLDTKANWGFFRDITVRANSLTGGKFCIITGFTGLSRILNTTKTESRDFVPNANSVVTGKIGAQLFGGELFVFPQFDEVFDITTSGVVPYIILCDQAAAYDRPTNFMKTTFKYDDYRLAYYFNAILKYNMTFIDETGVFLLNTKL